MKPYWRSQLAGWGLYVVVTSLQLVAMLGWKRGIGEPLLGAAMGIAMTHTFRAWVRPRKWLARPLFALAMRVFAASAAITVPFVLVLASVEFWGFGDTPESKLLVVVFAMLRWLIVFSVWMIFYFGAELVRRGHESARKEVELASAVKSAELRALRAQINPHFLFNTLNGLRALVGDAPDVARDAITRLSRILRYTLRTSEHDTVTFAEELAIIDDFLELEALRLGDRLNVTRVIDPASAGANIPTMVVHTLVENAIKHGIAPRAEPGAIHLETSVRENMLHVIVRNTRPSVATERNVESIGIGLQNVRERMRLLGNARLEVREEDPETFEAQIVLALETA